MYLKFNNGISNKIFYQYGKNIYCELCSFLTFLYEEIIFFQLKINMYICNLFTSPCAHSDIIM